MATEPNKPQIVGFFTVIGLLMLMWGWGWLKGLSVFHPPQRFAVKFHDVAGLNANAPVNINGVRIGTVEKIALKAKGSVLCTLKINSEEVLVPRGSSFTIQTLGLVGSKYVEITLPDEKPGTTPQYYGADEEIDGQDPVRTELIVNRMATNIGKIDFAGIADDMKTKMERVALAADSVTATSKKFGDAAGDAKSAAHKADEFFGRGRSSFDSVDKLANGWRSSSNDALHHISTMSQSWTTTSKKLNKILDNPALSSDLRETANKAKETADTLQVAMHELNTTLGDKGTRTDVMGMLDKINSSTDNIYKSVQEIHKISGDQGVRADLKVMLADARDAMDHVDKIFADKDFKNNFSETSAKVRLAATRVNFAATQLSQILDTRHPLFHMMFGRPGHIDDANKALEQQKENDPKAKKLIQNPPTDKAIPQSPDDADKASEHQREYDAKAKTLIQNPPSDRIIPQAPDDMGQQK